MTQQLILIAGPYRSGTEGVQARIDENLARLESAALAVYQRGHIPVIGEWMDGFAVGKSRRIESGW